MKTTIKALVLALGVVSASLLGPGADVARAQFPVGGINRFAYSGPGAGLVGRSSLGYGTYGAFNRGGFVPGYGYGGYRGYGYGASPSFGRGFGYPYGGYVPGNGFNLSIGGPLGGFSYSSGYRGNVFIGNGFAPYNFGYSVYNPTPFLYGPGYYPFGF